MEASKLTQQQLPTEQFHDATDSLADTHLEESGVPSEPENTVFSLSQEFKALGMSMLR